MQAQKIAPAAPAPIHQEAPMASDQVPGADDKTATLLMSLYAESGYSAETEYSISPNQWGRILAVAEGEEQYRLIAAAPDLPEALLYYRDQCSGAEPSISLFHQKLDAAIAKATGG